MKYIKGKPIEPVVIIAAYLGLRRSEALGLKWSDIDFEDEKVYIRRSRILAGDVVIDKATKTKRSKRALSLASEAKGYLQYLQQRTYERQQECEDYFVSDYVCCMEDGQPIKPNYVSHSFKKIIRKLNLPDNLRFHDLRHNVAFILIKHKHTMPEIMYWMGHIPP